MTFHVTDAKRFLASVDKITQAGNKVHFGSEPHENKVYNIASGRTIPLIKRNGVYIMEVYIIVGDKKIPYDIIVDSGAAENVMPKSIFPEVRVRFAAANGEEMGNYGQKTIFFIPRTSDFSRRA